MTYVECPVCGEETKHLSLADPDDDWQWKATFLLNRAQESEPILKLALTVRKDETGQHWVSSTAIVALGITRRLTAFDVLEIPTHNAEPVKHQPCDCLWEVQGYRESTREYWIRPLRVPDYVPDFQEDEDDE